MNFPEPLRAMRHRNFRLFVYGQTVSLVGTWMQMIAQTWLIYRLTGSAAALGLITFIGQVPMLVLAPAGGLLADRVPTRRLLLVTQTIAMLLALALGLLTLAHRVQLWHVVASAFLLGAVNAADNPGRQVFAAEAVPREDLMNAIGLNSSMVNTARVLGPAAAGLLVAWLGEGWCFMLNAASFLAVLAALVRMAPMPRPHAEPGGSALKQIGEGFAFAAGCLPIRRLLLLLGLCSLLGTVYSVLLPIFADQILHGGAMSLGLLGGAGGLGSLAGAVTLALRRKHDSLVSWITGSAFLFGAAQLAFAYSRHLALSALLLVPVGYAFMVVMTSTNTQIQMTVPPAFRGRVMSLHMVMFLGMMPLGGLLVTFLSRFLTPAATVAVAGFGCLAGATVFAFGLPAWREANHRLTADLRE